MRLVFKFVFKILALMNEWQEEKEKRRLHKRPFPTSMYEYMAHNDTYTRMVQRNPKVGRSFRGRRIIHSDEIRRDTKIEDLLRTEMIVYEKAHEALENHTKKMEQQIEEEMERIAK